MLLGVCALGWWAWHACFPDPKAEIRRRLDRLAQLASFGPNEGAVAKLADAEKLGGYFIENVQIKLSAPGMEEYSFDNREELIQAAFAARSAVRSLKARFSDMKIELTPGKAEAIVYLTLNADVGDDKDSIFQGLKFNIKKVERNWLITRIDTVSLLK